jgi:cell division septation protein DedD
MRNLFLALVLANLAFAAWHAWFATPLRLPRAADPEVPSLTLVSELPDDLRTSGTVSERERPSPDSSASASAPPAEIGSSEAVPTESPAPGSPVEGAETLAADAEGALRCTSVGPFRELSQAATAAATLRTAGFVPEQRVADGEIWIGYWVYIQAIPTLKEANEILAKVREIGISDSYVIPNSDTGNLVSLGVFSEISGVSRTRERARTLGYEPQVVDRTRRATVYWVDVMLGEGQELDFDSLQPPGRIVRLEQRPCDRPAQ